MGLVYTSGTVAGPKGRKARVRFLEDSGAVYSLLPSLPQGKAHSPVILGEEGDSALLGAVTLEIFGLVLNPFSRKLLPMRMVLA